MEKPTRSRRSKKDTVITPSEEPLVTTKKTSAKTKTTATAAAINALTAASTSASFILDTIPAPPLKVSKKKQFSVVAVVTPNSIEGSLQPETRKPLIAHLPIQSKDIMIHDVPIQYNPVPPTNVEPYDATIDNPFSESVELLSTPDVVAPTAEPQAPLVQPLPQPQQSQHQHQHQQQQQSQPSSQVQEVPDYYKKATLLVQYQHMEGVCALPSKVDAACFWCCHTFDWRPVVLPVRDQGDYIQVQGNFCCPECAMSYLFDMRQDSHTRWEQLSILNRLYEDAVGGSIRPAPPRQALKLFGGPMSIEEYRDLVRKRKLRVDIHMPPMVSLLATMDTKPIDFYDVSLTRNVMDTVGERLAKAEEVLKLRRTKPLKAWESTLDACINLKVRSSS